MRDLAIKAGFIDENLNGRDMNPLGPHSLRESFGSILANHGVPDNVIDFFLGHSISEQDQAYKRLNAGDLRKLYLEIEPHLSISSDIGLETKLKAEIDERNRQLQTLVNGLSAENLELKSRMARNELESTELKKRLGCIETALAEWKKELES